MSQPQSPVSGIDAALAVWHRRKWVIVLAFLILFSAAFVLIRSLPDLYEATATVLVEQPQVQERFVTSTVTAALETRLQTITQEILSRSRLNEVIMRFGLYPDLRPPLATPQMLADRMRADVDVETIEVRQPSGQQATIAFAISYRGQEPEKVAAVTNALAELYVERNASIRERQTSGTLALLRTQLNEVKGKLAEREWRLAEFKNRHAGELPEQQVANLAALERLNAQLRLNIDRQLRVMERQDRLAEELADGPPLPPPAPADDFLVQIAALRAKLADLRTQFTDEHPEVMRAKSQLAALEAQRPRSARPTPEEAAGVRERRIRDALKRAEAELAALKHEEQTLRGTIAYHQYRIENAPRREQELQRIAGDYAEIQELHISLLKRFQDAEMAERVEQGQQGEQFRILDSGVAPQAPVAPSRFTLLLMSLILAGAAGIGAGVLVEARDTSFHSVEDLRSFTTVPVLASIPAIATQADSRRHRARLWISAAAVAGCIAVAAAAASHVARNNEMLVRLLTPGRF